MRSLNINKRLIYYANPTSSTEMLDDDDNSTGEYTHGYGTPIAINLNVSAGKGNINNQPFGDMEDYDRIISTTDMDFPITSQTVFWVDTVTTNPHDYIVNGISDSINSLQIAIKKVVVADASA